MLTLYSEESSFKKKITVVAIWLVALSFGFLLAEVIAYEKMPLFVKILPVIIGIFMIVGILLRCKFARAFSLLTLYTLALFPLISNILGETPFILLSQESELFFSVTERLVSNIVWGLLFIIPIYFLSNNKSMDIFFIESNPKEHLFFIVGAMALCVLYLKFFI